MALNVGESIAAAQLVRAVFGPLAHDHDRRPPKDAELVEAAKVLLDSASKRMQLGHGQERLTTSRIREEVWRRGR